MTDVELPAADFLSTDEVQGHPNPVTAPSECVPGPVRTTFHIDGEAYFRSWFAALRNAELAARRGTPVALRLHAYRLSPDLGPEGARSEDDVLGALARLARAGALIDISLSPHLGRIPNRCAFRSLQDRGIPVRWSHGSLAWASHEKYAVHAVGDELRLFLGSLDPWTPRWDRSHHAAEDDHRYRHHFIPSHDLGVELVTTSPGSAELLDGRGPEALWPIFESAATRVIYSAGRGESPVLADTVSTLIDEAKRSVYIEDQYFLPRSATATRSLADSLVAALRRGVQVTVVIPAPSRSFAPRRIIERESMRLTNEINRRAGGPGRLRILGRRVAADSPQKVYIHSKLIIVDDAKALVGSNNFTSRSMHYDSEVAALVTDARIVSTLAADLRAEHGIASAHDGTSPRWVELSNRKVRRPGPITRFLLDSIIDPLPGRGLWLTRMLAAPPPRTPHQTTE